MPPVDEELIKANDASLKDMEVCKYSRNVFLSRQDSIIKDMQFFRIYVFRMHDPLELLDIE